MYTMYLTVHNKYDWNIFCQDITPSKVQLSCIIIWKVNVDELAIRTPIVTNYIINARELRGIYIYNAYFTENRTWCSLLLFIRDTYMKPALFICITPSQNCISNVLGGHCFVGKYANGERMPQSLKKMNWRCVTRPTEHSPLKIPQSHTITYVFCKCMFHSKLLYPTYQF